MNRKLRLVGIATFALVLSTLATTVTAASRTVACTYTALSAALANAEPGATVRVHSGTMLLAADQVITITKEVNLVASGTVIIKKESGTVNQPIISVALDVPAGVTIEGFTLKNSGDVTMAATDSNSAAVGINVVGDGLSDLDPAIIRDNSFVGFTDSAIVFSTSGAPQEHWLIDNNTFTNVFYGIFLNGANDLTILNNKFESYLAAITNANDTQPITLFRVTYNSFLGEMPTMSGAGNDHGTGTAGTRALNLQMNAVSSDADMDWKINKNVFRDHTAMALRFKAASDGAFESTTAVYVQMNRFVRNGVDIVNETSSDVVLRLNWWGTVCGPDSLEGQSTDDLWLVEYTAKAHPGEHGFRLREFTSSNPGVVSAGCR